MDVDGQVSRCVQRISRPTFLCSRVSLAPLIFILPTRERTNRLI